MATTIEKLIPRRGAGDPPGRLETAAREALHGLEDEDLAVSFSIWDDGESVQFVCKVETPPGDPSSSSPPWRWWSPRFRTAEELHAELAVMVARRFGRREAMTAGDGDVMAESAAAS